MSGELPSAKQTEASKAQSEADRSGAGKQKARQLQSDADRAAVPKHGL
ncbi:hypothetical protein [Cohnella lupini]|jgi:hypothetical protein|uniref:Uncharacterized protein n=1 Tax=Cohnella lupini TaxID=1294267 RepID=A0A3D9ISG1_9BACL|nr:hypothetical protein [Cohnella lupini]RED64692.1 hypothetical protein DFP95_102112 [Cohnella lupini]